MKTFLKHIAIAVFFLGLLTSYVKCGTTDPETPDSEYLEFAKQFHSVFKVCGTYNDDSLYCASAVVINEHWAITAAHVVTNSKICVLHKEEQAYLVEEIICHEDFNPNKFGTGDIALLRISKSIDLPFYPELYEHDDENGKICTIAGFGGHGTFLTGIKKIDQKMRAGSNRIDKIERDLIICSPSQGLSKTRLEIIICSGDSGGGLFIGNSLAGINSCVTADDGSPNSDYGDDSCHTRISKFIPWIKDKINSRSK